MQRQYILFIIFISVAAAALWWLTRTELVVVNPVVPAPDEVLEDESPTMELDPVIVADIAAHADLIVIDSPQPNGLITSPLTITGQARGYWFFEASFPVTLTNWDGLIIAEGYATADSDWMTEDFVPFTATLEYVNPYKSTDPSFMSRGSLILKKDNPSGLPENDDALELPIHFQPLAL